MKSQKGITLVSLVITIIVLSILASIATYSGISVIKSSKFTTFTAELKIMQTGVNTVYEDSKQKGNNIEQYGEEITKEVQTQANKVFTTEASGITEQTGYRYWSNNYIKNTLKIEGVEQSFFVNLEKRSVVSYEGLEYEGKTYYTLEQLPNGLYNVEYEKPTAEAPTFDVRMETISDNKWRITVSNIQYDGYIDRWQVAYQLENSDYWSTTKDLNFVVTEEGNYNIQVVNEGVKSESKRLQVATTVEEVKNKGKFFEKKTTIQDSFGNKVVVPEGFKIAKDSANTIADGIVIEDFTSNQNQFIWVPVDNIANFKLMKGYLKDSLYEITNCTEPFASGYSTETSNEQSDYNTMKKSVEENHGFYIGRFEAGKDSSGNVVVKKGADIYNNVPWGNAMDDIEGTSNTEEKVGAVKLSKEFASKNGYQGVTSTLCYGVQWDATMQFIDSNYTFESCEANSYVRNSTGKGWYSDNYSTKNLEHKTGIDVDENKSNCVKNIYDMAGNVWEWTMEAYNTDNRVFRGGGCNLDGQERPASNRSDSAPNNINDILGFRLALYL